MCCLKVRHPGIYNVLSPGSAPGTASSVHTKCACGRRAAPFCLVRHKEYIQHPPWPCAPPLSGAPPTKKTASSRRGVPRGLLLIYLEHRWIYIFVLPIQCTEVSVIYIIIYFGGCQSLKLKSLISRHTPRASGDGGRGERVIENKEEYAVPVEFTLLKTANQLARLDGALLLTPDRCRTRTTTAGSSSTGIIFQSMAAAPSEARTARSCVCTLRTRSTTCFCARWPNLPSVRRDGATISAALAAAGVK